LKLVIHIDMDAFFASVEQNDDPSLRGKPVVVGSPSERGVIAAASYEARKFGVRSAMPAMVASRLCPDLIFVRHRKDRYREVSDLVFKQFYRFASKVEPLSVDEAFLDVSDRCTDLLSARDLAIEIKEAIYKETSLFSSAGIACNKFLAKMASDMDKPNGLRVITPEEATVLIPSLPVDKFYGIGKVTAEKLHRYGIHTGAEMVAAGADFLHRNFGKAGSFYYDMARGIDNREVECGRERKSIGAELTFEKDLTTLFGIIAELYRIEHEVWRRATESGVTGRTITLKIKFDDFKQITRSITDDSPVSDFNTLHRIVTDLRKAVDFSNRRIRLMGVTISNFGFDNKPGKQLLIWKK
jgi:DNA polymerase-4